MRPAFFRNHTHHVYRCIFSDIGGAFGSLFWGKMSDRYGRRIPFLISLAASVAMCILRFYLQDSFYGFAFAGLAHGFFSPCAALGMAYASDVLPAREEKDQEITNVQAINMLGRTGGGILGILLGRVGLFVPLLAVAGLNFVVTILAYVFLIEPKPEHALVGGPDVHSSSASTMEKGLQDPSLALAVRDNEQSTNPQGNIETTPSFQIPVYLPPEKLDLCLLWNINIGALMDNFGTAGLIPFCLSPVMFNAFYAEFVRNGQEPILSEEGYKWVYVFIPISVVPGALAAPYLYRKIGPALSCVWANIFTGCITVALFYIASGSATLPSFSVFVAVLYGSFPLTVISQLSTGPMLDRIVPVKQRGELQGLHMFVMQMGAAIAIFGLAILADKFGIGTAIWIAFGLSLLAALINFPLSFSPLLQPKRIKRVASA